MECKYCYLYQGLDLHYFQRTALPFERAHLCVATANHVLILPSQVRVLAHLKIDLFLREFKAYPFHLPIT